MRPEPGHPDAVEAGTEGGPSEPTSRPPFAPSGFFVMRTPLLPFRAFSEWGEGLRAAAASEVAADMEAALHADKAVLRARLKEWVVRPVVREALFVGSPDLEDSLEVWLADPGSERGQRIERALVRYFSRMTSRTTPFGLFAGVSTGHLGEETRLRLPAMAQYTRHTRLDMDYVYSLAETLSTTPELAETLAHRPNSSLYRAAGRIRFVESRRRHRLLSYHLVAVDETEALRATLDRARNGAHAADLAAMLVGGEVSLTEANEFIAVLIARQILTRSVAPPVTGAEPAQELVAELRGHAETARYADALERANAELENMDREGLGLAPSRYVELAKALEELPVPAELPRLFQVDLVKPSPEATLGRDIVDEIGRGLRILERMSASTGSEGLRRFRDQFVARYEDQEVPLSEALDEEVGIGFGASWEPSALLRGLSFPAGERGRRLAWGSRERFLLRRTLAAIEQGDLEIDLGPKEIEACSSDGAPPLPDALAVMCTLAASSTEDVKKRNYLIHIRGAYGPSGANLLSRFCHADATLRGPLALHLRQEEQLHPGAVFAEIVHLPQGRVGNVLARPVLREYEIPYLGRSGAGPDRQIAIADLLVSVRGGRILLRSATLGREVIPRMSTAHAHDMRSNLGTYRFLGALQTQGTGQRDGWSWGHLVGAAFLPRVRSGRLVLSLATWRWTPEELREVMKSRGAARFRWVQDWRKARRVPRWVLLSCGGDSSLAVDLENVFSVESMIQIVQSQEEPPSFEELLGSGGLCAEGPEGLFIHELVVPFVRTAPRTAIAPPTREAGTPPPAAPHPPSCPSSLRHFPPGSEWLYAKLYTGPATSDLVLRTLQGELIQPCLDSGAVDGWFFLRYGDPDWHVRLRLHGEPARLWSHVLPLLHGVVAPLLEDGRVRRMGLDTYVREIERYGGIEGVQQAERLFHVDSDVVLRILQLLEENEGADLRWRLAFLGMHRLLEDMGLGLEVGASVLRQGHESLRRRTGASDFLDRQIGARFRRERPELESWMRDKGRPGTPLEPYVALLRERSERIAPIVAACRALDREGRLQCSLPDLALSCIHLHVNRLLRFEHLRHEMVLYDFLRRLYESQMARERSKRDRRE